MVAFIVLALLSTAANIVGQTCGIGGRPFLQVLFQAVFLNSFRDSSQVIATVLWVNIVAFSLGVPGYNALGLYDSKLTLNLATVSVPSTILGCSMGDYLYDKHLRAAYAILAGCVSIVFFKRASKLARAARNNSRAEDGPLSPSLETLPTFPTPEDLYGREGNFLDLERGDDVQNVDLLDEETDLEDIFSVDNAPEEEDEELVELLRNELFEVKVVDGIRSELQSEESSFKESDLEGEVTGDYESRYSQDEAGNEYEDTVREEAITHGISESIIEFRKSMERVREVNSTSSDGSENDISEEALDIERPDCDNLNTEKYDALLNVENHDEQEREVLRGTQSFSAISHHHHHVHWDSQEESNEADNQKLRRTVSDTAEPSEPRGIHRVISFAQTMTFDSLNNLSTSATPFMQMHAQNRRHSEGNIAEELLESYRNYGSFHRIPLRSPSSPEFDGDQWPLLDLALARYQRPSLKLTDQAILCFGGLLCGALGVGVAESVLFILVGVHNVPLAAAATGAISVAFYSQMTGTIMDSVKAAADVSKPKLADSVPWKIVFAILPGVAVGAFIGPRLHAYDYEKNILFRAAIALAIVSVCVALIDDRWASIFDWGYHEPSDNAFRIFNGTGIGF